MDNKRLILGALLAVVIVLIFQAYMQKDQNKINQNSNIDNQIINSQTQLDNNLASNNVLNNQDLQDVPKVNPVTNTSIDNQVNTTIINQNDFIEVQTDNYQIFISPQGGSIVQLGLIQYPNSVEQPNQPFLLYKRQADDYFVANSGLVSDDLTLPNHNDIFSSQQSLYKMQNQNSLIVPLVYENDTVKVIKKYKFTKGSYLIELSYDIVNKTKNPIDLISYGQFNRIYTAQNGNMFLMPSYVGGSAFLADKYQKLPFDDVLTSPLNQTSNKAWIALSQHHFFSAWIPPKENNYIFYSKALNNGSFNYGYKDANIIRINSGENKDIGFVRLYVGAKDNTTLNKLQPQSDDDTSYIAQKLYLTADYGWLAFLARPVFRFMQWIYSWANSWPLTIVVLVLIIKLLFFKLSETSYRSMAKMRKVAPRLNAIKERCGDDKAAFQKEMMSLYKTEKINPMSGCFPILVQIPVFIALYWVLLESVELRQVPFLWISDLTLADPYYILPIIMALTMLAQYKLNPKPTDPTQAKVMLVMPIVFSLLFVFFPAALVFYWVINNILSIAQQWFITKRIDQAS